MQIQTFLAMFGFYLVSSLLTMSLPVSKSKPILYLNTVRMVHIGRLLFLDRLTYLDLIFVNDGGVLLTLISP